MDPITTLYQRHADQHTSIERIQNSIPHCLKITQEFSVDDFIKHSKKIQKLRESYNVESLVLQTKGKTTSNKLLNIQAKTQIEVEDCDQIINTMFNDFARYQEQERLAKERKTQAEERVRITGRHPTFDRFREERVREGTSYPSVINDVETLKDIFKAYSKWAAAENEVHFDLKHLEVLCENAFGDSKGMKKYFHLRVFLDEEDVELFDQEHKVGME